VVEQRGSVIGRIRHGIDRHLQEWRRQDAARKTCAEVDRDELWAEAVEREKLLKLLAQAVGEEQARRASLGEVTEQRLFVLHSKEASEALGAFAREKHRLVRGVKD
jgi:hypothetical protein